VKCGGKGVIIINFDKGYYSNSKVGLYRAIMDNEHDCVLDRNEASDTYMRPHFNKLLCRHWISRDLANYVALGTVLESPASWLQKPPAGVE